MEKIDLLTIGDSAIDLFLKIDENYVETEYEGDKVEISFVHGSKVPVESFETSVAGNACNVALSCNKLGMKTAVYTELGNDQNGERVIKELKDHGIDSTFCIKNPGTPTNVHAIIVHRGERTIFSYHERRNYQLYKWPVPKWLFYSSLAKGFDGFQKKLVDYLGKYPGIGVAFNPGTQQLREGLEALRNFLEVTDVLFVNKEEANMILGETIEDLQQLHIQLHGLGPKLTVITEGNKGSSAYDGVDFEQIGVYEIDKPILDKTGAGDAYASGFIAALFYNKTLRDAMRWGTANSSSVIRELAATRGLLTKEELEQIAETECV